MKKILVNVKVIIFIVIIALMTSSIAFADSAKTKLTIVKQSSDKKYLENDQGYISTEIVDSNLDMGEVTVEVKLANVKKAQENIQTYENTEIYLMVSENIVRESEKLTKYLNNIENLSSKILNKSSNIKIGIIGIKGTIGDLTETEDGNAIIGDKDESDVPGRESDAEIVVKPTNDINKIKEDLNKMNTEKDGYHTNLQAAIRLANKSYSNNVNKILISLYDDVPDIAIGVENTVSYGGWFSEYETIEEAVKGKHEKISTYTRNEILTLKTSNISFILLRPDNTSYDETWYNKDTGEKQLDFDGSPYVQKLYGTIDNPTYGKMYSFDDNNIDKIITENIYQDVNNIIQSDIKDIKIENYFPKEIIDNFDFSVVEQPKSGEVSTSIDKAKNSITWSIENLKGEEIATLKYKLKLKDMNNKNLIDKEIKTNQNLDLSFKDVNSQNYQVKLESSPIIKLVEIKDNTMATGTIPQTGEKVSIFIVMLVITCVGIFIYSRYKKLRDIK